MTGRSTRPFLLLTLMLTSLAAAGVGYVPGAAADEPIPDPRDAETQEWEQQVAADARGDVLLQYPGTVDLYYLVLGELYSLSLGESYLFVRVGFNMTNPEDADVVLPSESPDPMVPDPPEQVDGSPLVGINVRFNVSSTRNATIGLFTDSYGATWASNEGRLIVDRGIVDGHREVVYFTPLRRFALSEGDVLSAFDVNVTRNGRLVDSMRDFDALNDPLPRYIPTHPLLGDPDGPPLPVPLPVPVPPVPPLPVPLPVPVPGPTDVVPNDPYGCPDLPEPVPALPDTGVLEPTQCSPVVGEGLPGPNGVPQGVPTHQDLRNWDPGREEPAPIEPERLTSDPLNAPESGSSWAVQHIVTEGRSRFVARTDATRVEASMQKLGWINFTVESRFEETDQRVLMLVAGSANSRWSLRYALDMQRGIKDLPAGETVTMGIIAAPVSLFATPELDLAFIFLSEWGGFDVGFATLVNMNAPQNQGVFTEPEGLPETLVVDLLNPDDPFEVNSPRNLMFRVRDGEQGRFVSEFNGVRAYIHPVGANPSLQPFQLREKDWMAGIYEIAFTFDKPGAWVVDLYFFDYPAAADGTFPSIDFVVHVDYEGKAQPMLPVPLALGSLGLVMAALVTRERLAKNR